MSPNAPAILKLDDRALVIACLHYGGTLTIECPDVVRAARLACDGFGDLASHPGLPGQTPAERASFIADLLWDWSHVRDSSPEAFRRAAEILRRYLQREAA